jgi:hypothetical protein
MPTRLCTSPSPPLSTRYYGKLTSSQADDDDLDALSFGAQFPLPRTPEPAPASYGELDFGYGDNAAAGPSSGGLGAAAPAGSGVSGKIGTGPSGSGGGTKSTGWGGVRMETRYTGESTLDEPVSATIVRLRSSTHVPWARPRLLVGPGSHATQIFSD